MEAYTVQASSEQKDEMDEMFGMDVVTVCTSSEHKEHFARLNCGYDVMDSRDTTSSVSPSHMRTRVSESVTHLICRQDNDPVHLGDEIFDNITPVGAHLCTPPCSRCHQKSMHHLVLIRNPA